MKYFLSAISFIELLVVQCQSEKCYQHSDDPYSFFASKTVYSYVSAKQNYTQPNCKTLQLWLLSRHGTRHPTADIIEKISGLTHYKHSITEYSTLCKEDIDAIKKWDFNLTKQDASKLNSQGANDLSSLGSRLRNVYKDLFDEPYNTETFKVLSSPKSRCVDSAFYFLKSAFGGVNITDIPLMDANDTKLNISKFKKMYDDDDDARESKIQEVKTFRDSEHMQQLLRRVSTTLGLDHNLTFDTVKIMYESCRHEKSWRINSHPAWCAVFSQEDLEILEYEEDLKYYYTNGYGDSYNTRIGCPIVKDLITNFRTMSRTRTGPKGVFYFGHSSNLMSAVVRLGIGRDREPLRGSDYGGARGRKWRTSRLSPFAANVMAALYECGPRSELKTTFFVNQVPVAVEELDGCTLCRWEQVEDAFGAIVASPECEPPSSASGSACSTCRTIWIFCGSIFLLTRIFA